MWRKIQIGISIVLFAYQKSKLTTVLEPLMHQQDNYVYFRNMLAFITAFPAIYQGRRKKLELK